MRTSCSIPRDTSRRDRTHRIPFPLNDIDISGSLILLTPAPDALGSAVETPAGDVIMPATAAELPGSSFGAERDLLPASPFGAHPGLRGSRTVALGRGGGQEVFQQVATHGVRYSLTVHAYSNLRLRALLSQNSVEPGATLSPPPLLPDRRAGFHFCRLAAG
ncbi:MAG: hypothetical protein ACOC7Y_01595 [Chloroflexota bacterium]